MFYASTFDQIKASASAGVEAPAAPIQVILDTDWGAGRASSWQTVGLRGGGTPAVDAIAPDFGRYGARRAKGEYDVETGARLARGLAGPEDGAGRLEETPEGDAGCGRWGRGRRLGGGRGGGRGAAPRAASPPAAGAE